MESTVATLAQEESNPLLTEQDLNQPIEYRYLDLARGMLGAAGIDPVEISDKDQVLGLYLQKGVQEIAEDTAGGDLDSFYNRVAGEITKTDFLSRLVNDYARLNQDGPTTGSQEGFWGRVVARRRLSKETAQQAALTAREAELEELSRVAKADRMIRILDMKKGDTITFHSASKNGTARSEITGRVIKHVQFDPGVMLEIEREVREVASPTQQFAYPSIRNGERVVLMGWAKPREERHNFSLAPSDRLIFQLWGGDSSFRDPAIIKKKPSNPLSRFKPLGLQQITINGVGMFPQS